MIKNFILVGIGGGIGAMLRYLLYYFLKTTDFPLGTLVINIIGSFIIGLVIAASIKNVSFSAEAKLFLATGICGGFTTFSSFSVENILLIQEGRLNTALLYTLLSVAGGIAATWLGFKIINNI
ncbi:MAG: fluoride efflux transporter CrcB [Bacteroidetes bacterium]|nr:fluoride efflux transporter CrcB [Bacteroidota bacterium]MBS1756536.1 fluoride efflux transporter CrcB [Bacteroidota bacterium]